MAGGPIRPVDLDHAVVPLAEKPCEPRPVRARALDAERGWRSIPPTPLLELGVPRRGCGDEQLPKPDAQSIQRHGDMQVLMGIGPDDELPVLILIHPLGLLVP